jgi:hypothetical protein
LVLCQLVPFSLTNRLYCNLDDEQHPYLLAIALEALWCSRASLRDTLPLCRKIRDASKEASKIWAFSQMSLNKRNATCQEAVNFLAFCEEKLARGTLTLDRVLIPPDLVGFTTYLFCPSYANFNTTSTAEETSWKNY